MSAKQTDVMQRVRRALGRTGPLEEAPIPPSIPEPIARLVHSDIGLPELFAKHAAENSMGVETVSPDELAGQLVRFLKEKECRRIGYLVSPLLERLGVGEALREAKLEAQRWDEMTLDDAYEYDAGVTDIEWAVAETGSLVIRPTPGHGRALSLVPPVHVAIVEPKRILADLVDLFESLGAEDRRDNVVLITGPSKTSDIEMNLVVGVHGPMTVQVFMLR